MADETAVVDETAAANQAVEVDEVILVSASRHITPLNEVVGSATQLSSEALAAVNAQHIQQALVQVPGVTFSRGDGVEYLPGLRSPVQTGAGACGSILSTIDGIPLRAAGFCNINELFEAPTELGASLEVLSGPWSTIYGSNALTGVINVLTPEFGLVGNQAALSISDNNYYQFKGLLDTQSGDNEFIAALSHSHDGGYRDSSGYNQQKLLVKHRYAAGAARVTTSFNASRLDQQTAAYLVGKDSYKDKALSKTNPSPEAYRKAHSLRLASQIDQDKGDWAWQITPYARHVDMEFLQHFLPGTPIEQNRHSSLGVQSGLQWQWLDAGLDLEWTRGELLQYQENPTQGSDFLQATIPVGKHYDYEVDSLMASPFVQANIQVSDALRLTLAGRYDWQQYDYNNRMNSGRVDEQGYTCGFGGCRYSRPESSKDRFGQFSPKLGLNYRLTQGQHLFTNASRGHRAPQATELYRLQRAQSKADLKSETIDSLELGWRGYLERINWQLAGYWMQRDNLILRDSDFFNVSGGNTKHRGVEGQFRAQLSQDWQWQINASYARHTYGDIPQLGAVKGNKVDSAPAVNASSQLNWNAFEGLRATLEWIYVDEYYTDAQNLHKYDGHQLLNLRGQWQISRGVSLNAKLDNLLDTRYAERADYSSFAGDRYFPGRGRTLLVQLVYQFDS
ncbi:hypothetical protein GCM10007895_22870 [Paraferrimonas sedimenticola]|uniref:TonB-dependent receptor n=1 Tax=Paraferrimonas sedimenticola TaxID=375674 RepID=A0AA37RX30_9GAMM|nr:hypothetical protein GCM10007895_22870 [Paraferrimonas sedimenticola]